MFWFLFAAASPTFYSISNFIDKYLVEQKLKDPLVTTTVASLISGVLGLAMGAIFGFSGVNFSQICLLIFAGLLLTFYLLPYFTALKTDDVSRVVPLFQFIPVFTLILSAVVLKETLATQQIIGLIIVVIGGVFLSAKRNTNKLFRPRPALWYMLLAGLMYGSVGILFRFVAKDISFWTTLAYEYLGTGLGGLILFAIPSVRKSILSSITALRSSLKIFTVNNSLDVAAQMSESYALSIVPVPYVNLIGSIQPTISLVFGYVLTKKFPHLIKEDIRTQTISHKLVVIVLMFIGLYLVYF